MKLVFIYGPPAAGKLTVAKELQRLTGFKLFHNHSVIDLISFLFKWGSDDFYELCYKMYLTVFEAAAKSKTSLIFTFCYARQEKQDNAFVRAALASVKPHGTVCFVHLYCDKAELYKRVKGASRVKFGKIKAAKRIREAVKKWDFYSPIPFVKSLRIDNTHLSAPKAAALIRRHFRL